MNIGGQAVIEGVMMRDKEKFAVAVRLPNGKIKVKREKSSRYPKFFDVFFFRGVVGLVYMLRDGFKALSWSSNQQLEVKEKIKKGEMVLTMLASLILGLGLFLGLPFLITKFTVGEKGFLFGLIEGLLRAGVFVGYLWVIGFSKEVQRLFQYHGAEHKVINCYEKEGKVSVERAKKYSTRHQRCGTTFVFIILILSIIIFSFLEVGWLRLLWKLLLIPVIAGISYELLKLGDKFKGNLLLKGLTWPGLRLQAMTTKEPDEKQIEVGIKALEGVVE